MPWFDVGMTIALTLSGVWGCFRGLVRALLSLGASGSFCPCHTQLSRHRPVARTIHRCAVGATGHRFCIDFSRGDGRRNGV